MLNEFIDRVIVYERRKINRYQYDQQIEIYFNFIGKVTLPEEETEAARKPPKRFTLPAIPALHPSGTTSPRRAKKRLRCRSPRWRN